VAIERWTGTAVGRSSTVANGSLVWTVANAREHSADFDSQVLETLALLDANLKAAGSDRKHILSVQALLANVSDQDAFDRHWCPWIGSDPQSWP